MTELERAAACAAREAYSEYVKAPTTQGADSDNRWLAAVRAGLRILGARDPEDGK